MSSRTTGSAPHSGFTDPHIEKIIEMYSEAKPPLIQSSKQRLEETCERVCKDPAIADMSRDPTSATYIPLRVRDIVRETMSAATMKRDEGYLARENVLLQKELQHARRESDDIEAKYEEASEKAEQVLILEQEVRELKGQNADMKQALTEFTLAAGSKERQNSIIQMLQSQVEDYRFQCDELRVKLETVSQQLGPPDLEEKVRSLRDELLQVNNDNLIKTESLQQDLKMATEKLNEQKKKVVKLVVGNQNLREQLEESQETNSRLAEDIKQLTGGWRESQDKLKGSEEQWRKTVQQESLLSRNAQRTSLSTAGRRVSRLKQSVSALGSAVKRNLNITQREMEQTCTHLKSFIRQETEKLSMDKQKLAASLHDKERQYQQLKEELNDLRVDHEILRAKHEMTQGELEKKVHKASSSLSDTQHSCLEQSQTIRGLEAANSDLASQRAHLDASLRQAELSNSSLEREVDVLKTSLREVVELLSGGSPIHSNRGGRPGTAPMLVMEPFSEVRLFDTPCDVDRVCEWAVGVAKHQISSRDSTIQMLRAELVRVHQTVDQKGGRVKELEEEVGAHVATGKMTSTELETCTEQLAELNKSKLQLEIRLEEAVSQRKQLERQFAQSAARVEALVQDKQRTGVSTSSLEETNRQLRFEVEQAKQELQLVQIELTNKQNGTRKLELQLKNVEEEAEILRRRITDLEAIKMEQEKEMADQVLYIDALKMENSQYRRDVQHLQDNEASTVGVLTEVQAINKELEEEKRQLVKSLQQVTDKQVKLDEENVHLEKLKMSNVDEIEKLKEDHSFLSEQVDDLDKSLGETEMFRLTVQQERDSLKHEVAVLREALGKCKQALAEVQIQRGKLTNKITVMTQEKGDLITGKVELSTQVIKLQEHLNMSKERITSLHVIKDRLGKRVSDLEKKLEQSKMTISSLEEENIICKQDKQEILAQKDQLAKAKDNEISALLKEKNAELHQEIMAAKSRENLLQNSLDDQNESTQNEITMLEQTHADTVTSLTHQHKEMVSQLKEELNALSTAHQTERTRYQREKEAASSRWDKEKSLLNDRAAKLQKVVDDKTVEMSKQQQLSNSMAAEQKAQLDVASLNARRLETELVASEKRLWDLQNKLDDVTNRTNDEIDSLQTELNGVSNTVTKLEAANDDSQMTIKSLENRNHALQLQESATQKQLEKTQFENEQLKTDCQSLENNITSMTVELSRLNETMETLQEQLSRAEEELAASEEDAASTHKLLSEIEQTHAQLVRDHATVQSQLTATEKENTKLNIDLVNARNEVNQLAKSKEIMASKLLDIEGNYTVLAEKCQLKEKQVADITTRVVDLEKEKRELNSDLSKAKNEMKVSSTRDAIKITESEHTISNLKTIKDNLEDNILTLQTSLNTALASGLDQESKISTITAEAATLSCQLEQNHSQLMDVQQRHAVILGVLENTLDVSPTPYNEYSDVFSPTAPTTTINLSLTDSRPESGFGDSVSSPLHSPGVDSFDGKDTGKQPTAARMDPYLVRDAILALQKKVMVAERTKNEALANVEELNQTIAQYEEEKMSLESRLKSLRSSLVSLQTSFDSVSKQRDQIEQSSKKQQTVIIQHENAKKDFERVIAELKKQLEANQAKKKENEAKLKKFADTQVSLELDRNKFETKAKQLEMQRRKLEEEIVKMKTSLSHLETTHVKKDAELARLQQKLVTSQHQHLQIEEDLQSLTETHNNLGTSYSLAKDNEKRLLDKIKELESKYVQAQSDKKILQNKVSELQDALNLMQKERDSLDEDFCKLTQSNLLTETERLQLREKVQELHFTVSDQEVGNAQLSTQLQTIETRLQEEQGSKYEVESRLSALEREKKILGNRIHQLECDLHAANKERQLANELCVSLEEEITHVKSSLHQLREDYHKLKTDTLDTTLQNSRLDAIISDQQRQKSAADRSLLESSKQNIELMRTVREMEHNIAAKEREHHHRLLTMAGQVSESRGEMRMNESKWSGREQGYQKTIHKMETKVNQLEGKLGDMKKKKVSFLQQAQEADRTIQDLRNTVEDSITALANAPPSAFERELKSSSLIGRRFPSSSPCSSASQSPTRYSYYSSLSPSRGSLQDPSLRLTSTPMK